MESLMVQHERSVIESLPTELTGEPRCSVLLPDVLLHRTGLHFLGAVRTGKLLRVAVHSLAVVVEAAGKLEGDSTLITVRSFTLLPTTPSLDNVLYIKFLFHSCKIWKLVERFSMLFHNMDK